jgi:putative drug/metabolite transporter DUF486
MAHRSGPTATDHGILRVRFGISELSQRATGYRWLQFSMTTSLRKSKTTIMPTPLPSFLLPIFLLSMSNVFMTFAWYGHLKLTDRPLWIVIVMSWSIAFVEYAWLCQPIATARSPTLPPNLKPCRR